MSQQLALDMAGGYAIDPSEGWVGAPGKGEIGAGDPMPPGPYTVGLTHTPEGDMPPWTVVCGDGRAVAGHVPSRECAEAIVEALHYRTGELQVERLR